MKKGASEWSEKLKPDKIIHDAQHMIKSAVDVLEGEIAAGILAAKKLEKKVLEPDEPKTSEASDLMERIRVDMHNAVDLIVDAISAVSHHIGNLSEKINSEATAAPVKTTAPAHQIPVVKNDTMVKAGTKVEIPIQLHNEGKQIQKTTAIGIPDLTGPAGKRIAAKFIHVSPDQFTLEPGKGLELMIAISVPKSCPPGVYSGLFHDTENDHIRVVLVIQVV